MGVSFTISKKGKIYKPQPKPEEEVDTKPHAQNQGNTTIVEGSNIHHSSALAKSFALFESTVEQLEALGPSVYLNLFLNGFTISDTPEFYWFVSPERLFQYNSRMNWILSCVESGQLPAGIFDDMPCKYVNGTVLCEVRDYRDSVRSPTVKKVPLKMGLQNIVSDISKMPDLLTHKDMLKFQSIVLRTLHPFLHLDPTTKMDNFKETIPMAKIDLELDRGRKSNKSLVGDETSEFDVVQHEST